MGWFDDIVNDIEGALNSLGDVLNAIENAVETGGQVLGTVLDPIGAGFQYVINGVAYDLFDLVGIHMRSLTNDERNAVRGVFQISVPLDKILVTSIPGKDGRPFTLPGSLVVSFSPFIPGLGPLLTLSSLILNLQDKYLINVGSMYSDQSLLPSKYDTNKQERPGSMLVHETTHVWQGVNSAFSWWYVFDSLYNQALEGSHAYDVDETHLQTWDTYGVEQQAHLVEDWYSRGSQFNDVCYPFIRDNIRPARPWATTVFTVLVSPFQAGQTSASTRAALGGSSSPPIAPGRSAASAAVFRPGVGGIR